MHPATRKGSHTSEDTPLSLTVEEELLAALLGANEDLQEALRVYADLETLGVERETQERSRKEVRIDRSVRLDSSFEAMDLGHSRDADDEFYVFSYRSFNTTRMGLLIWKSRVPPVLRLHARLLRHHRWRSLPPSSLMSLHYHII